MMVDVPPGTVARQAGKFPPSNCERPSDMSDSQIAASRSRLEVTIAHDPLAFFYGLFTPTVAINGIRERRPWGTHQFDLDPGEYEVAISYPWIFSAECGKNTIRVRLLQGAVTRVRYRAGLIRYLPGSIAVVS